MKARGNRDRMVIATKVGALPGMARAGLSRLSYVALARGQLTPPLLRRRYRLCSLSTPRPMICPLVL
jgi:hypothetical protein